jgi:hypothetical protein
MFWEGLLGLFKSAKPPLRLQLAQVFTHASERCFDLTFWEGLLGDPDPQIQALSREEIAKIRAQ